MAIGRKNDITAAPGSKRDAIDGRKSFCVHAHARCNQSRKATAVATNAAAPESDRTEGAGLDWTFLSPSAEIHPGERTGEYRITGDQFLVDAEGRSTITYEDYAVALVDELERPRHVGQRFGVAY